MEDTMELFYDPADRAVLRSPHALFARLRSEDPVHWSPKLSSWVVTSYEHAATVFAEDEFSSDRLSPFYKRAQDSDRSTLSEVMRYIGLWLVFRNPPEHTRLRRLMNKAINPGIVAGLQPNITSIVHFLLDNIETDREFDFMSDFAVQLPAMVIMDMMGVPRDMLFTIKAWSDDLINFVGSPRSVDDKYERARAGGVAMAEYFGRLIAERRAEPKNDILTMLIQARDDQSMLTDDEVVASAMLLLFAGHETTTNLLGNALMALHANPDQQDRLRQDPGLIDTAVEEFLRFDGPVLSVSRAVAKPHELGGKALEEGNRVFVMITAANRDPAVFADPDRVDLARMPNRHMTFGKGIHFCLGASLARLEAKTAFNEILHRYRSIELTRRVKDLDWIDAMVMRGVRSLPVRVTR
jgi:cytochrome P450